MRTAEEIMNDLLVYGRGQTEAIVKAINEARKELLLECAEMVYKDMRAGFDYPEAIKNSILDLISELK